LQGPSQGELLQAIHFVSRRSCQAGGGWSARRGRRRVLDVGDRAFAGSHPLPV